MKKILYVMLFVFVIFGMTNVVLADEAKLLDSIASEDSYSFSQDEASIYLPFVRASNGNITVDKETNTVGSILSNARVEINKNMNKMTAVFAKDSIRINANVKNSVFFATNSIVIDAPIDGDIILFAVQEVTITEKAVVNGDIICFTNLLNVKGNVKGSVIGVATKAVVTGPIDKDLRIECENFETSDEKLIKGNVYVETNSVIENIKNVYPEAIVKVIEEEQVAINYFDIIMDFIFSSIILTAMYILIYKLSKNNFFKNQLDKVVKYKTPIILVSTIGFLAIPFALIIGIILSVVGFSVVAVPAMFIYLALIVTASMLSVFTVGSTIITIIDEKFLKGKNIIYLILTTYGVFLLVGVISKLSIAGVAFAMYSLGIITIALVKRSNTSK